jgi:hypothetical protein
MSNRALESTVKQAQHILTDLIAAAEVAQQEDITRKLQTVVMALNLQRVALEKKR